MFSITLFAGVLSLAFVAGSGFLFFFRPPRRIERLLAAYLLSGAFWIAGNALADIASSENFLVFASGIAFLGGSGSLVCIPFLIDALIGRNPPWWHKALYLTPSLMWPFAFSHSAIESIAFPPGAAAEIVPGPLYTVALLFIIAVFGHALIRLAFALKTERGAKRMQILWVVTGLLLTLTGELLFDDLLPILGEVRFYTLGPVTSVFFAGCIAYATSKHHLMDVRVIVQRGLIYTGLISLIVVLYLGTLALFGFFFGTIQGLALVSAVTTNVIGIFTVPVIERYFREKTDVWFFKGRYRYADALRTLTEILYKTAGSESLSAKSAIALQKILRADVRIVSPEIGRASLETSIPIIADNVPVAAIVLGKKYSGDEYTQEDTHLLETFAYEAATAFSRAKLYAEVTRHAEELEQKVAARTEELRRTHERERQTMLDISHGLQTPLAVFGTTLEKLKGVIPQEKNVALLEASVRDLSRFIYDLLKLAWIENDTSADDKEIVLLSELVRDIAEEAEVVAHERGITVAVSTEEGLSVRGSTKQLREAIMNIVNNSLEHMRAEGPRRIAFALSREGDAALLSIADTGEGIAPEELPKIFTRFYRGKKTKRPGGGLGLAITKGIVEQLGGAVAVESAVGTGTSTTVQLPLA